MISVLYDINVYVCGFLWQVVATFQRMRQEQRSMASKAAELEMEINEHRSVADVHTSTPKCVFVW